MKTAPVLEFEAAHCASIGVNTFRVCPFGFPSAACLARREGQQSADLALRGLLNCCCCAAASSPAEAGTCCKMTSKEAPGIDFGWVAGTGVEPFSIVLSLFA
ncbi:unnamed protein product [Durusdinium trenchii]|uniref:Uncharacterized protein n=1 Tax=Durusdinium trenchii TaxID=1381693 RepID=A0ABP0N482_9DINO